MSILIRLFLSGLVMSFAWPVRGQFGHEQGATICGVLATFIACGFISSAFWRQGFAQAVIFGIIGFGLGGGFGYGSLVDTIMNAPSLSSVIPQLIHVFLIGAIWGGLGMTFIAYGLSELNQRFWEAILWTIVALLIYYISTTLSTQWQALLLLTSFLLILHAFSLFMQRSQLINLFGLFGFMGFGFGFLISTIILWYGNHGYIQGNWWSLRDQIWGFIGGCSIYIAAFTATKKGYTPSLTPSIAFRQFGFISMLGGVIGINLLNVYQKWFGSSPLISNEPLALSLCLMIAVFLVTAVYIILCLKENFFNSPKYNILLLTSTLFFCFILGFLAIMKSIGYSGISAWETGFTLIVLDIIIFVLTFPLLLKN